jgi:superfamily II DNA or RNA helicase
MTDIESKLRAHQSEPANRLIDILSKHNSAVDLSDTGTGKTYVASAVACHFNQPTLVIAPKIALTAWRRAAEHFGDKFSVINYELLRMGHSGLGQWENQEKVDAGRKTYFTCQCCQQVVDVASPEMPACYTHPTGIHCIVARKKTVHYGRFVFHSGIKFAIFDEVHRCGGLDSLNAELLIAAKRQGIRTLGLSATAACSPLNMRALGYLLDFHSLDHDHIVPGKGMKLRNFYAWARKYKCWNDPQFRGFKWFAGRDEQLKIMSDIRDSIIPARGVRVRTTDIPGFPAREITAELYDLDQIDEIDKLYEQMADALSELDRRCAADKASEHPLTKILRARQRIELLKVPVAVELCADFRAKGYSVALFVNFKATISELCRRLNCSAIIDGSVVGDARQRTIDDFQSDQINCILVNSEAGGIAVSLHDTEGNHPRVGLVFPTFSAVTMKQVFGRLHRDGGKSTCHYRMILAANTVETSIHRALRGKLNNLDALNDADLMPDNLRLTARA